MSDPTIRGDDTLTMATVRGWGRTYADKVAAVRQIHTHLSYALRMAHKDGHTITELADASGLSRQAVARAVRPEQPQ